MIEEIEFKKLSEDDIKNAFADAFNKCLEIEEIEIDSEIENDFPLEHDYYNLLNDFENHLKLIIKLNKKRVENND